MSFSREYAFVGD